MVGYVRWPEVLAFMHRPEQSEAGALFAVYDREGVRIGAWDDGEFRAGDLTPTAFEGSPVLPPSPTTGSHEISSIDSSLSSSLSLSRVSATG